MSFVRYPPGRANVWIPVRDARSAAAGLSLLTFSKPLPLLAQRTLHRAVLIAGPWLLPGRREKWQPPVDGWDAVLERGRRGGRPGRRGGALPAPAGDPDRAPRPCCSRNGRPVGFLKVREGLEREAQVLRLLAGGDGFRAPVVLGAGRRRGW